MAAVGKEGGKPAAVIGDGECGCSVSVRCVRAVAGPLT